MMTIDESKKKQIEIKLLQLQQQQNLWLENIHQGSMSFSDMTGCESEKTGVENAPINKD